MFSPLACSSKPSSKPACPSQTARIQTAQRPAPVPPALSAPTCLLCFFPSCTPASLLRRWTSVLGSTACGWGRCCTYGARRFTAFCYRGAELCPPVQCNLRVAGPNHNVLFRVKLEGVRACAFLSFIHCRISESLE